MERYEKQIVFTKILGEADIVEGVITKK